MAYEPTQWKTGDVVTSAKLNKLENAVANGGEILVINVQNDTLDKTYQEIEDAFVNKMLCVVFSNPIEGVIACDFVIMAGLNEGKYRVDIYEAGSQVTYIADTKDDYPVTDK